MLGAAATCARQLVTGDFIGQQLQGALAGQSQPACCLQPCCHAAGELQLRDMDRGAEVTARVQAHKGLVNSVDCCGGQVGCPAPCQRLLQPLPTITKYPVEGRILPASLLLLDPNRQPCRVLWCRAQMQGPRRS